MHKTRIKMFSINEMYSLSSGYLYCQIFLSVGGCKHYFGRVAHSAAWLVARSRGIAF